MAVETPICEFGWKAPTFSLPGVDNHVWTLDEVRGPQGTLIVFICNHCPYVRAVIDRLVRDARDLQALGIGVAAISSNDAMTYPEDSFDKMAAFAQDNAFSFPYLYDESQEVARAYGAVCTPDFFGFDAGLGLHYRGRLDSSGRQPAAPDATRELFDAMSAVAKGEDGPSRQIPSMGCSIKWKVPSET